MAVPSFIAHHLNFNSLFYLLKSFFLIKNQYIRKPAVATKTTELTTIKAIMPFPKPVLVSPIVIVAVV